MIYLKATLVIVSSGNDFFTAGSKHDGVFELSRVAALDVAQRRVSVHDTFVAQILERHLVFGGAGPVQPPFAESQRAKVFIDQIQERLGRL